VDGLKIIAETSSSAQALNLTKIHPRPTFGRNTLSIKFAQDSTINGVKADKLKEVLNTLYNAEAKALNLQATAGKSLGGITVNYNTEGFVKSLFMAIVSKYPELETLNLAENQITSLNPFGKLEKYPLDKIKNVSFSGNLISSLEELKHLRPFKFRELSMQGNPITSDPNYVTEMQTHFDSLKYLDGNPITVIDIGLEVEDVVLPPLNGNFFENAGSQKIAEGFLEKYITMYDSKRTDLKDAYAETSLFSLSTTIKEDQKGPRVVYVPMSRDLKKPNASGQIHQGPTDIINALEKLPASRHVLDDVRIDAYELTRLNTPLFYVTIHGHFKEGVRGQFKEGDRGLRSFSRTFLLCPNTNPLTAATWPVLIVNEQFHIRPKTSLPAVAKAAAEPPKPEVQLNPQQQGMVSAVAAGTRLKPEWAMKLLEESQWNMDVANANFIAARDAMQIQPEMLQ